MKISTYVVTLWYQSTKIFVDWYHRVTTYVLIFIGTRSGAWGGIDNIWRSRYSGRRSPPHVPGIIEISLTPKKYVVEHARINCHTGESTDPGWRWGVVVRTCPWQHPRRPGYQKGWGPLSH